ncbi:MAG: hypothetical protein HYX34_05420 [Actinobacteria bacterium]|nr:hypothetical protein [Actinomycetota bacterium]
MTANDAISEDELVDQVVAWLRDRLPPTWEVERTRRADSQGGPGVNAVLHIKGTNGTSATLLVAAKRTFTPRSAEQLLAGMTRAFRTMYPYATILAIAQWISPQAQERLREDAINYVDLTGNAWLRLDNPAVFISAQGSSRNPKPTPTGKARVRGPKASRLIRWLVDIRPPYGVRELAAAADLSQSYVSRVLDALDEDALVERNKRGAVESVDTAKLIQRWVNAYSVLTTNSVQTYIARQGASSLLDRLPAGTAVTGSFAAVRRAPVAAPALLAIYSATPEQLASTVDLLPADQGSNVLLLKPYDPVVWQRTTTADGLTYVADSQAVVDCLTGTGRMPAEGHALLDWMLANESVWRVDSLEAARQA